MDRSDLSWDLLRTFLAVAEEGSLSAAARTLGLTQPTAGRHIAALEAGLGRRLFLRGPGGLVPTPAALGLRPHAEAMRDAALTLARTAADGAQALAGAVRITASQTVGAEVLPALLTAFHRRHPAIRIELALTNRSESLTRREADIAVRMVRPSQAALVAKRIGRIGVGLYAHEDYLAARGVPRRIEDLAAHSVIGVDRDAATLRALGAALEAVPQELFAFRSDSDAAQLSALRAGFGIGGCQHGIAAREPGLKPVLADRVEFGLEMWLAMHEDLRGDARMRLVFDHLAEGLGLYAKSSRPRRSEPSELAPRRLSSGPSSAGGGGGGGARPPGPKKAR